jgi:hypothetical protein
MQSLEVSGMVRHIYIYVIGRLKVNDVAVQTQKDLVYYVGRVWRKARLCHVMPVISMLDILNTFKKS